jgi:hypothetical protein
MTVSQTEEYTMRKFLKPSLMLSIVSIGIAATCVGANCQPPPASEVVQIEDVVCWVAEDIPQTSQVATYLCSVLGIPAAATSAQVAKPTIQITVKVPGDQVSAFSKTHKIIANPYSKDTGK